MEGTSQQHNSSGTHSHSPSDLNTTECKSPRVERSPVTARVHNASQAGTGTGLSPKLLSPSAQVQVQPYEGSRVNDAKKDEETGEDEHTDDPYQKGRSDSVSSSYTLTYDYMIESGYEEDAGPETHRSARVSCDPLELEVVSGMDSAPLVGEQSSSSSSDCHTTPFVAHLFSSDDLNTTPLATPSPDHEGTSTKYKDTRADNAPRTLAETLALSKGENCPRLLVNSALPSNVNAEENVREVCQHQQGSTSQTRGESSENQVPQTDPPREITLQPSTLSRILHKPLTSRVPLYDYHKSAVHTPPPSYQESLSYPVVHHAHHQPPPPSMVAVPPGYSTSTSPYSSSPTSGGTTTGHHEPSCCSSSSARAPKDSPLVSIIRLSSPMAHTTTSMTRPLTRDSNNVYVWHSPSEEACSREARAQDQYSDHQILALLACIMFWPVGLLAIYYANMANILRSEGVHATSLIYSKRALLLSLVSFLIGTGVYLTFYLQRQIAL